MIIAGNKSPIKNGRHLFKGLPFTRVSSAHLLGDMWYLFDANAVTNTQEQQTIGSTVSQWFSCAPGTTMSVITSTSAVRPIQRVNHIELGNTTTASCFGSNLNGGLSCPVTLNNFTSYIVLNIFSSSFLAGNTQSRYIALGNGFGPSILDGQQFGGNTTFFSNRMNFLVRHRQSSDRDTYLGGNDGYLRSVSNLQENEQTKIIVVFTSSGSQPRTLITNRFPAETFPGVWTQSSNLSIVNLYPTSQPGTILRLYEFGLYKNALSVHAQDTLFNYLCARWL